MLHPDIACDIAAGQRKARLAQAATIAQALAAAAVEGRFPRCCPGRVIAAAADGLTSAQEAAYARGVRVDHRATLMAAVFKEVNTGSGES